MVIFAMRRTRIPRAGQPEAAPPRRKASFASINAGRHQFWSHPEFSRLKKLKICFPHVALSCIKASS
jgi:hypothetical protein